MLQEIRTNKTNEEDQILESINVTASSAKKTSKQKDLQEGADTTEIDVVAGLDFDFESDKIPTTADAAQYETCYVTSHKAGIFRMLSYVSSAFQIFEPFELCLISMSCRSI